MNLKHYLIEYAAHGVGDPDYHEVGRIECATRLDAIDALAEAVTWAKVNDALNQNDTYGLPYWVTETRGFAVASDMEVDPIG